MAIQTFTLDPNATRLEDDFIPVRNETGGTLTAGTLVYVSGWHAATSEFLIAKAIASPNTPKLAQFVMRASLATATSGFAYKSYTLTGQDTSTSIVGAAVYLGATAGVYTLTTPSFAKQIVGRVSVVNAVTGEIEFLLLADSDGGFVRSGPGAGEFPVASVARDVAGHLEVTYDDVAV